MGCDFRVDILVEVDFQLIDLSHLLFTLEQVEGEQFSAVVLGVRERLSLLFFTSTPR